ncbi:hypothetical protein DXU77_21725 [Pseudomonas lactis]|nr:hypothetical protein [Pseudomonas lactis]OOV97601.1 hypothetical protein MF6394_20680 [Pseudomonas sp. MF6394]
MSTLTPEALHKGRSWKQKWRMKISQAVERYLHNFGTGLRSNCGLPAMTACQPTPICLTPHNPNVGAGLPAMTASQPTPIYLIPHNPNVGAGLLAKAA